MNLKKTFKKDAFSNTENGNLPLKNPSHRHLEKIMIRSEFCEVKKKNHVKMSKTFILRNDNGEKNCSVCNQVTYFFLL